MDYSIMCRNCGSEYTHEFATIMETRLKEDTGCTQMLVMNIDNKLSITQRVLEDNKIRHRRNNCYHLLACENCNSVSSICVYQHKGLTNVVEKEFPLSLPDIPNLTIEGKRYIYFGFPICNDGWCGPSPPR